MSKDSPEVGDVWSTGNIDFGNYTYTQRYFIVDKHLNGAFYVMAEKNERCPINSCFILEDNDFKHLFYLGKSKVNIDDLFKTENEEEWTPLSKLGCNGINFDLIQSNVFLECVKAQGFVDDDGDGYPVIKADDGTFLYNKKKSVYPSEIQNKDKLDFDYVAWFNK